MNRLPRGSEGPVEWRVAAWLLLPGAVASLLARGVQRWQAGRRP